MEQRETETDRDGERQNQETDGHGQTERGRRQRRDPWRGAQTVAERRETETEMEETPEVALHLEKGTQTDSTEKEGARWWQRDL